MKNIKSISYSYNNNFKEPILYHINTDTVTTSLSYKDALEIAFAVIDSLNGSYEYLENLVDDFKKENEKGIRIESII